MTAYLPQLWRAAAVAASAALFWSGISHAQPPRRAHHALIYDEANQRVLLTGGSTPLEGGARFEIYQDLWSFDGTDWTALPPSGFPQSDQALAYDARRHTVLSIGGFNGSQSLAHVLELENGSWRRIGELPDRPTGEGGLVFDARRGRFVLFGGSRARNQAYSDTWEFDGTSWTKLAVEGPAARQAFAMVYDEKRGKTVLFGGSGVTPNEPFGDTWEFDGASWSRVATSGPPARVAAGAAYDAKRGLFIVFGGMSNGAFVGDTWGWNGSEWRQLTAEGPEPRAMARLAYDRARDRVVLFGGRKGWPDGDMNDTWEWDGEAWKRVND
jgi:hypothetical protein